MSRDKRPILQIPFTTKDYLLEGSSWLLLTALWVYTIYAYQYLLPDNIAIHFNVGGKPDDYGHKASIFILPVVASFICIGFYYLCKVPHLFNYPGKITEENALTQYQSSIALLRIIKLIVIAGFFYINYTIISRAPSSTTQLSVWFLPLFIGSILTTVTVYIYRSGKKKSS